MKKNGFTLIELMITVAIVAILAAIAYPSYQDSVRKTHRANAKAGVMEAASFMARFFTENNTYAGAVLPGSITADRYNITISAQSATVFTLQAAPTGSQSSDSCGTMTLSSTNIKTAATADCW